MTRDERETPGGETPKVTVNIPGERYYSPEEVDDLLREVTAGVKGLAVGRGTRIDARSRVVALSKGFPNGINEIFGRGDTFNIQSGYVLKLQHSNHLTFQGSSPEESEPQPPGR